MFHVEQSGKCSTLCGYIPGGKENVLLVVRMLYSGKENNRFTGSKGECGPPGRGRDPLLYRKEESCIPVRKGVGVGVPRHNGS